MRIVQAALNHKLFFQTVAVLVLCLLEINCSPAEFNTAGYYLETAQVCLDKKDYTLAVENLTKSIELDPSNAEAWNSRAYAYFFSGDYKKAIADYTETLRIEPEMGVAYVFRSHAYTQTGEPGKAAADMESLYRLVPDLRKHDKVVQ